MVRKALACMLLPVLVASLGLVVAGSQSDEGAVSAGVKEIVSVYYGKPDKPPGQDKDKDKPPVDNTYFELLGIELMSTAEYYVNPSGAPSGVVAEIQEAFGAWDAVTAAPLFEYGDTTTWLSDVPDGQNTIGWRGIIPRDIVAMARIWAFDLDRDGMADDLDGDGLIEVAEFDITFNALQKWGIDGDDEGTTDKLKRQFDVENVATHEVGHVVGLADLYEDEYRELTMYGYVSKGETQKISLEEGDIAGAQSLYG